MRYHSARVVLGACLLAASAAAQAPASSFSSTPASDDSLGRADNFGFRPIGERLQNPQDPSYQLYDLFRTHHGEFMDRRERYTPQVELRARAIPNGRVNHEPGSFDMLGYDFDAEWPVLISTEAYLTFGAYYLGRRYVTSDDFGTAGNAGAFADQRGFGDETLVGAGVKLGFGVFLDDNTLLEVETHPGVWSDLDDGLHHEDFDFPSHALFTFRTMDNFFFKVGARYNQVFDDAPWLPYLGFSWEVTEGFRLDILAPESIEMSWWPSSSLGISFGANVTGAEYHVHTDESLGQRDDLRVQEIVSYLGLVARLNDYVSFSAKGGLVVAGDYDLTTGAAGFNRVEGALDQSVYAEVGFGISF